MADKKVIFQSQKPEQLAVFNADDPWQRDSPAETAARVRRFSGSILPAGRSEAYLVPERGIGVRREQYAELTILKPELPVPGEHNRLNLFAAALAACLLGLEAENIRASLASFASLEHRLEYALEKEGVCLYSELRGHDPARLSRGALQPSPAPFSHSRRHGQEPRFQLAGRSDTAKIEELFGRCSIPYAGPFADRAQALAAVFVRARRRAGTVLFSPGCASFELFLNEFDRSRKFKELVRRF